MVRLADSVRQHPHWVLTQGAAAGGRPMEKHVGDVHARRYGDALHRDILQLPVGKAVAAAAFTNDRHPSRMTMIDGRISL